MIKNRKKNEQYKETEYMKNKQQNHSFKLKIFTRYIKRKLSQTQLKNRY